MKLVFATNNDHKIREVKRLLKNNLFLQSLKDIGCTEELPETGNTLEENAAQKARYVYSHYKTDCFADDTGLEIQALNGRPGVLSARYAGEEKSASGNSKKVLFEMKNTNERAAKFRTVIALIFGGKEMLFEGIVNGIISLEPAGDGGFGYDPIFIPDGFEKTFAQMSLDEKNRISHRAMAVQKLAGFLNDLKG